VGSQAAGPPTYSTFSPGFPPGVSDNAWELVTYDLTPYKNPALRVRFGFDLVSPPSMGSWTLEGIAIGDAICP